MYRRSCSRLIPIRTRTNNRFDEARLLHGKSPFQCEGAFLWSLRKFVESAEIFMRYGEERSSVHAMMCRFDIFVEELLRPGGRGRTKAGKIDSVLFFFVWASFCGLLILRAACIIFA